MKILVINGPNMNMLGIRQPEIYGHATYEDLKSMIAGEAERLGAEVSAARISAMCPTSARPASRPSAAMDCRAIWRRCICCASAGRAEDDADGV